MTQVNILVMLHILNATLYLFSRNEGERTEEIVIFHYKCLVGGWKGGEDEKYFVLNFH